MSEAKAERQEEKLARLILEHELGVTLCQYDTGKLRAGVPANGQFDYLALTDPPQPVEVIGDHTPGRPKQAADLDRKGSTVEVPGLDHGWVLWLLPAADVAQVKAKLPAAFATIGDMDDARERAHQLTWQAVPPELATLGVDMMSPLRTGDTTVRLVQAMVGHSSDEGDLGAMVDATLGRQSDAAAKVLQYLADRRHIVIVSMFGAAPNEWSATRHSVRSALTPPHLPAGVTDVWVIFAVQPSQAAHFDGSDWRLFDPLPGLPEDLDQAAPASSC